MCVCVSLSLNQPLSHTHKHTYTHPMQATSPPKTELLSLFFHHTALEVSPATCGTRCSPTALGPSLRARGNTATPKRPAAPPMMSGSLAPSCLLETVVKPQRQISEQKPRQIFFIKHLEIQKLHVCPSIIHLVVLN